MRSHVFTKNLYEHYTIPEGAKIQLTLASPQHQVNIEMNTNPSRILDQADFMPVFLKGWISFLSWFGIVEEARVKQPLEWF